MQRLHKLNAKIEDFSIPMLKFGDDPLLRSHCINDIVLNTDGQNTKSTTP